MNTPLTKEEVIVELAKCKESPIYFAKYAYVVHPKLGLISFKTFDYQDELLQKFVDNRFNLILKSRQIGISTVVAIYCAWMMLFWREKNIVIISKDMETGKAFIEMIKTVFENLPVWLKPKKIVNNVKSVKISTGSKVKTLAPTKNAARSFASSLLVLDECVAGDTKIKIRNKKTHEEKEISIKDLMLKIDGKYIYG